MNQAVLDRQCAGSRASTARAAWIAALGIAALAAAPLRAQAQEGGAVLLLQERPQGWERLSAALEQELHAPVRLGRLAAWVDAPDSARLQEAEAAYQKGVEHFLALKLDLAEQEFLKAQELYRASWEQAPTHTPSLEGLGRSAFYGAWASLEGGDKRQARDKIATILQELPAAAPDPNVFPPPFVEVVEDVRKRARKGIKKYDLSISAQPPSALCVYSAHRPEEAQRGECKAEGFGATTAWIGGPGLGVLRQTLDPAQAPSVEVDLGAWPEGLARPKAGHPLELGALGTLGAAGEPTLALSVSDASLLGGPGAVLWVQELPSGALTAAVVVGAEGFENPEALAKALAPASRTPSLEVFEVAGGGWLQDGTLQERVEEALSAHASGDAPPLVGPDEPGLGMGLGAYVAAGAGLATEVTDPGLAPTPLVFWLDGSYALSERLDLGLALRFQAINFAALAQPYARLRLGPVWVQGGVMLGQITHQILQTENRDASTSQWVGPSVGLQAPLGWLSLGVQALAPLFPTDPTVHVDALLGVHFDL